MYTLVRSQYLLVFSVLMSSLLAGAITFYDKDSADSIHLLCPDIITVSSTCDRSRRIGPTDTVDFVIESSVGWKLLVTEHAVTQDWPRLYVSLLSEQSPGVVWEEVPTGTEIRLKGTLGHFPDQTYILFFVREDVSVTIESLGPISKYQLMSVADSFR
jgi:hypothetical protein